MTRLYLLGQPTPPSPPTYRGIDRPGPRPVTDGQRYPLAAASFEWFASNVEQDQSIRDEHAARRLISAYQQLTPPEAIELIGVTDNLSEKPVGEPLGYDVAARMFSLLGWGLKLGPPPTSRLADNDAYRALWPLLEAVGDHYRERLNENGLFVDPATGMTFLTIVRAAHEIRPGLWEEDPDAFAVIRVCRLA